MSEHTTLYRLYSSDNQLLYIGIAGNPGRRFEQHAGEKPWWTTVSLATLEHFSTRQEAMTAELNAIRSEAPIHNIVGRREINGLNAKTRTAVITAPKPNEGILKIGDVVALGLADGECPVGMVEEADDIGVRLDLYSWLAEHFASGSTRVVFWHEIARICHAKLTPGEPLGYTEKWVWDMDPLADFQTTWKRSHA